MFLYICTIYITRTPTRLWKSDITTRWNETSVLCLLFFRLSPLEHNKLVISPTHFFWFVLYIWSAIWSFSFSIKNRCILSFSDSGRPNPRDMDVWSHFFRNLFYVSVLKFQTNFLETQWAILQYCMDCLEPDKSHFFDIHMNMESCFYTLANQFRWGPLLSPIPSVRPLTFEMQKFVRGILVWSLCLRVLKLHTKKAYVL